MRKATFFLSLFKIIYVICIAPLLLFLHFRFSLNKKCAQARNRKKWKIGKSNHWKINKSTLAPILVDCSNFHNKIENKENIGTRKEGIDEKRKGYMSFTSEVLFMIQRLRLYCRSSQSTKYMLHMFCFFVKANIYENLGRCWYYTMLHNFNPYIFYYFNLYIIFLYFPEMILNNRTSHIEIVLSNYRISNFLFSRKRR